MFYFDIDRTEDGITALGNVLKQREVLPDFGAKCFAELGKGHEKLKKTEDATMSFMMASSSYFLLFKKGIPCLGDVIRYLAKVVELGDGKIKGDAELITTAIFRLSDEDAEIPDSNCSKIGEALREALNGNRVEIKPENEIDLMVMLLINDLLSSKN